MADRDNQINWLLAWISGVTIVALGLIYCYAIPNNPIGFSKLIQDSIPSAIVVLLSFVIVYYLLYRKKIRFGQTTEQETVAESRGPLIASLIAPKVIRGLSHVGGCLCLLEPSQLFLMNAMVSIFHVEGEYERFVGNGRVLNVQDNGIIQVLIQELKNGNEEILANIASDQRATINNIKIKSTYLQSN